MPNSKLIRMKTDLMKSIYYYSRILNGVTLSLGHAAREILFQKVVHHLKCFKKLCKS